MNKKQFSPACLVNQVKIVFTLKPITAWGGICSLIGKYVEKSGLRGWVEEKLLVTESSNNSGGIYEKVLAQLLTVLCGGE